MHPVITLLIIFMVALVGYFFPKKYNEYFYMEYHKNIVSVPLAITTAIVSSLWLLFMDSDGFWYWALLIISILFCIISIIYVLYVGWQVGAGAFEIVLAVLAQIFAIAGVIILILGVLSFVMELFGTKKKRK